MLGPVTAESLSPTPSASSSRPSASRGSRARTTGSASGGVSCSTERTPRPGEARPCRIWQSTPSSGGVSAYSLGHLREVRLPTGVGSGVQREDRGERGADEDDDDRDDERSEQGGLRFQVRPQERDRGG